MVWIFHHVAVGCVADVLEKLDDSIFTIKVSGVGRCLVYISRWFLRPFGERRRG
jgi:hypothetical protein